MCLTLTSILTKKFVFCFPLLQTIQYVSMAYSNRTVTCIRREEGWNQNPLEQIGLILSPSGQYNDNLMSVALRY